MVDQTTRTYSTSIEIDAEPDAVFEFLVTDEGMTSWMGQHAALDARVGGGFAVDIAGYAVRGEFLVVDRPHRVVVSWGMAGVPGLPPGASRVEFRLSPVGRGTRVELLHSDLPTEHLEGHRDGWSHFLDRLRVSAAGGDPGQDRWRPSGAREN